MQRRTVLLVLATLVAGAARAEVHPIVEKDLGPKAPRVLLAHRSGPTAALAVVFSTGAVDDLDQPGLTRLSQQALLVANRQVSYEKLFLQLFRADASLVTTTGLTHSAFLLTSQKEDFLPLATLLLNSVLSPVIDPERVGQAKERAVKDAAGGAPRDGLIRLLAATVVDDWRYNNDTLGDKTSIEGTQVEQIREHLAGPMSPARATIILAGDFDERRLLGLLQGKRGGARLEKRQRPPVRLPIAGDFYSPAEILVLAYPIDLRDAKALAAGRVMGALIEERLRNALRGAGLGYSYAAFPARLPWSDMLVVVVPGRAQSKTEMRTSVGAQLGDVAAGRYTEAEFERNRRYQLELLRRQDEDPAALVAELAGGEPGARACGPALEQALATLTFVEFQGFTTLWVNDDKAARLIFSPTARPPGAGRRR